jgi:stage III sporulation protein AE
VTGIVAPTFTATAALGFAVGLLGAIDPEIAGGVSGSVSKFFSWLVGIVTALLMGTLALQTVIGSVKDCASIRAARYAASGMIPVVGGTVAASLATLASGIAYVKGVIGVGAAAVIITLFLSPLVLLLLYRGAISIASTVASMLSVGVAARLYDSLRRGVDLYIAIYAVSILIYIFEIILFVMTEVPLG